MDHFSSSNQPMTKQLILPWDHPFSPQSSSFDFFPAICFTCAKKVTFNDYMFFLSSIFFGTFSSFRVSSRKETFTISKQLFRDFGGRRESYSSSDWLILPYFGFSYSIILDTSLSKPGCFDSFFH